MAALASLVEYLLLGSMVVTVVWRAPYTEHSLSLGATYSMGWLPWRLM
jgi:hypothetical protein